VLSREYHAWGREHIVVDTAGRDVEKNVEVIRTLLDSRRAGAENPHP
jgi:hypothetical protein